jgi:hypothetical protein
MHASPVDGFHWKRREAVEARIVLHWRLMVWVVSIISMPSRMVILERFLVVVMVVLVIHLQLAHVDLQQRCWSGVSVRVWEQVSVLGAEQSRVPEGHMHLHVVLLYLGGVGDLRAAERIHA